MTTHTHVTPRHTPCSLLTSLLITCALTAVLLIAMVAAGSEQAAHASHLGSGSPPANTSETPASADHPQIRAAHSLSESELGRALSSNERTVLGPGHWHRDRGKQTWYGAYRSLTNLNAYCVDAGLLTPYPKFFTGVKPRAITSPRTAWALSTQSQSTSADVQAAVSSIVKLDAAIPHRHAIPPRNPHALGARFAGTARHFDSLNRQAKQLAGPYRLSITLGTARQSGENWEIPATVSLTSAAGVQVPKRTVRLTHTGARGATSITTASAPVRLTLTATSGTAKVSTQASAAGLPSNQVLLYRASGRGSTSVQNVVSRAPDVTVKGSATRSLPVATQPSITTKISSQTLTPGATVTDRFTVQGLGGSQKVDVAHTLWASPTRPVESKEPAKGVTTLATVTSTQVGNGTHTSPAVRLPATLRGWVYWTETIRATKDVKAWSSKHGIAAETGVVPWTPTAQTRASYDGAKRTLTDAIAVSGGRPGSTVQVTATAYEVQHRPVQSAQPQGRALTPQVRSLTLDATGTASFTTEPITVEAPWATWVVSIDAGEGFASWQSDWGIPEESVQTTPPAPSSTPPTTPATTPPSTPPPASTPPASTPPPTTAAPRPATQRSEAPPQAGGSDETPTTLPRTGTQSGALIGGALILLGVGAGAVVLSQSGRTRLR